jgi:hypothetical protein
MTAGKRLGLLAAVIVIAVVAFIALKPSNTSKKASAGQTTEVVTTANGRTTTTEKPVAPPVVQVNVKGGKPVGGIKKISVNKGDPVSFVVNSDVSDEIHVHGYDFMKDVKAGGSVKFSFPAKIDGVFVIELEGRGEQIASLEVQP